MTNSTPIFAGFHLQTIRRKPRPAKQIPADEIALARRKSFDQLGACFGRYLPGSILHPKKSGNHSRRRLYSQSNTFWAFFSQVLDPDGGCREVVSKIQSYATLRSMKIPSGSTAAYCNARKKLAESDLEQAFHYTSQGMAGSGAVGLVGNRRVVVVDGTELSMPDTPDNQAHWPQYRTQKPGCGFPAMKLTGCFLLKSSAMLSYRTGNKHSSEPELFRQQWNIFRHGDIMLGDKAFCTYYDLAMLGRRGGDCVAAIQRNSRKVVSPPEALASFGKGDLLIEWKKPRWHKNAAYTREQWEVLPRTLRVRQIEMTHAGTGGKPETSHLITTLLDPQVHPAENLIKLYRKRWDVELFFRDIKVTMDMDILRCKTPEMTRKELLMHLIVYNCVRRLMYESASKYSRNPECLSFKIALQSIRQREPHLEQANRRERRRILDDLECAIVQAPLPERQRPAQPRCVTRRPKSYQNLTTSRQQMEPTGAKGKYRAIAPATKYCDISESLEGQRPRCPRTMRTLVALAPSLQNSQ